MSLAIQKRVWKLQITAPEKLVLLCLADFASDKDLRAYPSIATIADATRLSERQVQRHLAALVDAGHIAIDENPYGGRGKSRVYRFKIGKGDTGDTVSSNERVTSTTRKGDANDTDLPQQRVTSTTERVTSKAKKGDIHDETYIRNEPLENHQEPSGAELRVLPGGATAKERKPMPRNGMAQTLLATLHEDVLQIGPPTNYGRAVRDAQKLSDAGCTPGELQEIAAWLLSDPFWSRKGVTINTILNQRDNWKAARIAEAHKPKKADAKSGLVYG